MVSNGESKHSGFTPVPNSILDCVMPCRGLGAAELRVLLFLLRKILGWQEKRESGEDFISLSQIEHGANVTRAGASAALKFWTNVGVISVAAIGKRRMNLISLRNDTAVKDVVNNMLCRNSDRLEKRILREEQKLRRRVGLVS